MADAALRRMLEMTEKSRRKKRTKGNPPETFLIPRRVQSIPARDRIRQQSD
jgi:hypothetical protein